MTLPQLCTIIVIIDESTNNTNYQKLNAYVYVHVYTQHTSTSCVYVILTIPVLWASIKQYYSLVLDINKSSF